MTTRRMEARSLHRLPSHQQFARLGHIESTTQFRIPQALAIFYDDTAADGDFDGQNCTTTTAA